MDERIIFPDPVAPEPIRFGGDEDNHLGAAIEGRRLRESLPMQIGLYIGRENLVLRFWRTADCLVVLLRSEPRGDLDRGFPPISKLLQEFHMPIKTLVGFKSR